LIDFNEYVYVADQRINMSEFTKQYIQITGGTYNLQVPVLQGDNIYYIQGVQFTGFTTTSVNSNVVTA
jgi:hypothetical protein